MSTASRVQTAACLLTIGALAAGGCNSTNDDGPRPTSDTGLVDSGSVDSSMTEGGAPQRDGASSGPDSGRPADSGISPTDSGAAMADADVGCTATEAADYRLTFDATWSETTHPDSFPPGPHFSGLIGLTHDETFSLWSEGSIASDGIEQMAETGGKSLLRDDIAQAMIDGGGGVLLDGGGIGTSPDSNTLDFSVSPTHPMVAVVSMIAPSPDWFVGVDSLSLCEGDSFVERTVELFVYDAGTDSGPSYTSPNDDTVPREPITRIEASPFEIGAAVRQVGTFTFRLR